MASLNSEFAKRCGICKKNKQSRSYPFQINGVYLHLCKECWEEAAKKVKEADIQDKK